MSSGRSRLLGCYVNGLAVVLLAPLIVVLVISFSGDSYMRFPPTSLSLQWFRKIIDNAEWRRSFSLSVTIALLSTSLTVVIAGAAAYGLVRGTFPGKKIVLSLLLLPIIVPTVVVAVGLYFISLQATLIGNLFWVACCHSAISIPPVLLILLTTLHGIDVNLERAAFSLGCGQIGVIRRVVIPLAAPGLITASVVAFLSSFDDFILSLFLIGPRGETLPVRMYHSIFFEIEPTIAAVSTVLIVLTAALIAVDRGNRARRAGISQRLTNARQSTQ